MRPRPGLMPTTSRPVGPACPRFRPGMEVIRNGPRRFTLLNTRTGAHFKLGAEERYLLHLLERIESPDEVLRAYEARFGPGLSRRNLLEFLEQLRLLGVLADADEPTGEPAGPRPTLPVTPAPAPLSRDDAGAVLNGRFDLLAMLFGWMLHPIWIVPILLLTTIATNLVVRRWDQFQADLLLRDHAFPFLPLVVLTVVQTLIGVSFPRELLACIACRLYGGRIKEFGIHLVEGLVPTFYFEYDGTMVLKSRRGRWTLLSIDIWYRLAFASVAIIAWSISRPGSAAAIVAIWQVPHCVAGLVLNFVPFYKYSGYLMLCSLVREPMLRERALAETRAWLDFRRSPEALTRRERFWLRTYGLSCLVFRHSVDAAMLAVIGYVLAYKFKGLGALISLALMLWWYRAPIGSFLMANGAIRWAVRCGGYWWVKWPSRLALLGLFVTLGLMPYNHEIVGECRLIPAVQQGVRVQLDDEIAQIHVSEGDLVEPGAPIATLVGRKVKADVKTTRAELDKARADLDLMLNGYLPEDVKMAAEQAEIARIEFEYLDREATKSERLFRQQKESQSELEEKQQARDRAREGLVAARENYTKLKKGYRVEEIEAGKAEVRRLEELLKYYEELLALTEITAPIRGRVVMPYMEERPGQSTKVGDLITVIQDTSTLRVEVAADESASAHVKPKMPVKVRLYALDGRLLTGRVERVAPAGEQENKYGNAPVRNDREALVEQDLNSRSRDGGYHTRVYAQLDETSPGLTTEMAGYSRIVVGEDVLWRAIARPIVRFLRTEVWSWLP